MDRLNLSVDEGIPDMMSELAGGERKRGAWLSELVRNLHSQRQQIAASDIEQLRMGFTGLVSANLSLDSRLTALESRVTRLERQPA